MKMKFLCYDRKVFASRSWQGTVIFLACLCVCFHIYAENNPGFFGTDEYYFNLLVPIPRDSTSEVKAFELTSDQLPAVLVADLVGYDPEKKDWQILVSIWNNEQTENIQKFAFNAEQIENAEINPSGFLIDIKTQIESGEPPVLLKVKYTGDSPAIRFLKLVVISGSEKSLQIFDHEENLVSLKNLDETTESHLINNKKAILQLITITNNSRPIWCNAFHIGYGWALTNHHCTHSKSDHTLHRSFSVFFDNGTKRVATVMTTDLKLDYSLIRIKNMPSEYSPYSYNVHEVKGCELGQGTRFAHFQFFDYKGVRGRMFAKHKNKCSREVDTNLYQCKEKSIQHQCDSAESSSGSPLVLFETNEQIDTHETIRNRVAGLHYGGQEEITNCATCIEAIAQDLNEGKNKDNPELTEARTLFGIN